LNLNEKRKKAEYQLLSIITKENPVRTRFHCTTIPYTMSQQTLTQTKQLDKTKYKYPMLSQGQTLKNLPFFTGSVHGSACIGS
jgi:hypothetical protein